MINRLRGHLAPAALRGPLICATTEPAARSAASVPAAEGRTKGAENGSPRSAARNANCSPSSPAWSTRTLLRSSPSPAAERSPPRSSSAAPPALSGSRATGTQMRTRLRDGRRWKKVSRKPEDSAGITESSEADRDASRGYAARRGSDYACPTTKKLAINSKTFRCRRSNSGCRAVSVIALLC